MFGRRYEKVESLKCRSPLQYNLKHFFMTRAEHLNLVTRFVHDGDGDVTNLNLPIVCLRANPVICARQNTSHILRNSLPLSDKKIAYN